MDSTFGEWRAEHPPPPFDVASCDACVVVIRRHAEKYLLDVLPERELPVVWTQSPLAIGLNECGDECVQPFLGFVGDILRGLATVSHLPIEY